MQSSGVSRKVRFPRTSTEVLYCPECGTPGQLLSFMLEHFCLRCEEFYVPDDEPDTVDEL